MAMEGRECLWVPLGSLWGVFYEEDEQVLCLFDVDETHEPW